MSFDDRAQTFDTDRRKRRAKVIAAEIRKYLPESHRTGMEFGCGTGLIGMELLDAFEALTFVDSSQGMVDQLRGKIAGVPGATAVCADLLREPMDGERFDCVFSSMVMHHIPETVAMLDVLRGLLNEGGWIVVVDLDVVSPRFHEAEGDFDGHDGFDQAVFAGTMREAGLRGVRVETFYRGEKDVAGEAVPYSLFIATAQRPI